MEALERAAIWPRGTVFHREPVPRRAERLEWASRKRQELEGADVVFVDPDNGIGKETAKHATFSEIGALRKPGRVIVFINFPGRHTTHDEQLREMHQRLAEHTGTGKIVTLRTSVSVPTAPGARTFVQRQRWLTALDADEEVVGRIQGFATRLARLPRMRVRVESWKR